MTSNKVNLDEEVEISNYARPDLKIHVRTEKRNPPYGDGIERLRVIVSSAKGETQATLKQEPFGGSVILKGSHDSKTVKMFRHVVKEAKELEA